VPHYIQVRRWYRSWIPRTWALDFPIFYTILCTLKTITALKPEVKKMKGLGVLIIGCMMLFSCAGHPPENLGVRNNRLAECPAKPNCVSSQAVDEDHFLPPIPYQGEKEAAVMHLKKILSAFERMTIRMESDNYLHIECKSAQMGFVDDLEFYFPEEKQIQVRSASRIGYSDLGVNRKRVETLRALFAAQFGNTQK